jgi:hypothetical protein
MKEKYQTESILRGYGDGVQHSVVLRFGICPSPDNPKNATFLILNMFPSSDERLGGAPTLFGRLDELSLKQNH